MSPLCMKQRLARFLLPWLVPLCSCGDAVPGSPADRMRARGLPIIYGEPDDNPAHNAVVAVYSGNSMCSGTLIAPRVVMTAGHCADGQEEDSFLVLFGSRVDGAITRTVSGVEVHPEFDLGAGPLPPSNDLALLQLSTSPPPGVTPIPWLPHDLGITTADIGRPLEFVGFGENEAERTGIKLTVTNDLDIVCVDPGDCRIGGYTAVQYSICTDQSPGGPCSGDSGGPALIVRGDREYVAGATSYGTENCLLFGCSTKVDEFEDFIEGFVAGTPGTPCEEEADCRSGYCVKGVCCETECTGACMACDVPGALGTCAVMFDGASCSDGNVCNGEELCQAGECMAGTPPDCDDGNQCTRDVCEPEQGCTHPPVPDETPCANHNRCDGREVCSGGVCQGGKPPDCDDDNPCTEDWCNRDAGCMHEAVDDGQTCGESACGEMVCSGGTCVAADPQSCNDGNPCTIEHCDPQTGCQYQARSDGVSCGVCKECRQGRCVDDPDCEQEDPGGCGCQPSRGASGKTGAGPLAWLLGACGLLLLGRRGRPGWLALACILAFGCGPEPAPLLRYHGRPIINGSPDDTQAHQAVVAVYDNYALCTGTLVAPRVVMTAGHCISQRDMVVLFGHDVSTAVVRQVIEKRVHPDYTLDPPTHDIAMLRLGSDPPPGVAPIPWLPQSLAVASADIGSDLVYVGYGTTETGDTGLRLTVTNQLEWICTRSGGCSVGSGYPAYQDTICADQSPGGPCHGDSGGPAFIHRGGQEYVAGVTSYGDQYCQYFGCSTKVDAYEDFIVDFVGGVQGAPCTATDQCLPGLLCVDGVCCQSVCDGVCQACNLPSSPGVCATVPDETPCPDRDLCDGQEVCRQGQCLDGAPLDCTNDNLCTRDDCDPATGCLYTPVADGAPCPNANLCDGEETCLEGVCQAGAPLDCDDLRLCTRDRCEPATGCAHEVLPDGTACGGGACGPATCAAGVCVPEDTAVCDDADACTRDWCDPASGCAHENRPDGYACGDCRMCMAAECIDDLDCVVIGGSCGCGGTDRNGAGWLILAGLGWVVWRTGTRTTSKNQAI